MSSALARSTWAGRQAVGWVLLKREALGRSTLRDDADAFCSQPGLPLPAVRSAGTTRGDVQASYTSFCGMRQSDHFVPNN